MTWKRAAGGRLLVRRDDRDMKPENALEGVELLDFEEDRTELLGPEWARFVGTFERLFGGEA